MPIFTCMGGGEYLRGGSSADTGGRQDNRIAVINKIHHCMFDGISGIDLTQILFSPKPDYEIQEAPPYVPHSTPSGWELLRDAIGRRASLPFQIVRGAGVFGRQ